MHGGGQTLGFSQILRRRSVFKTWKASFLSLFLHTHNHILIIYTYLAVVGAEPTLRSAGAPRHDRRLPASQARAGGVSDECSIAETGNICHEDKKRDQMHGKRSEMAAAES